MQDQERHDRRDLTRDELLIRIDERTGRIEPRMANIETKIGEIEKELALAKPVRNIVFGLCALILAAFVSGILALVLRSP